MIAIVGPTASGKTALAMRLAGELGAEIVCADSRVVYRGMDIGTAKPTARERERVRHHCVDVVDPEEPYDAARYRQDALRALADIGGRGKPALLVGGTGLYVRTVLDGLDIGSVPRDPALRRELEELPASEVVERLAALDPAAARTAEGNLRRAVRYLEIASLAGNVAGAQRRAEGLPALRVGLAPPRPLLDRVIEVRVRQMVADGVLDETRALLARGLDPSLPSASAHGYVHWAAHLRGELDLEAAIWRTVRDTRAYSRRQMTWFRRDPEIVWYDPSVRDPLPDVLQRAA